MTEFAWKDVFRRVVGTPGLPMTARILLLSTLIFGMGILLFASPGTPWVTYAVVIAGLSGAVLAGYSMLAVVMTLRAAMPVSEKTLHLVLSFLGTLFGYAILIACVKLGVLLVELRRALEGIR